MIIGNSPVVRCGFRAVIENEPTGKGLAILGEAGLGPGALDVVRHLRPDVVLLDLPPLYGGSLGVCRQLRQLMPETCILVLSSSADHQWVFEAILAGAHGYLSQEIDPPSLIAAIRDGYAGRPVISGSAAAGALRIIREQQTARPKEASRVSLLSPQELKVLTAVAAGHTNKEIAGLMGLSINTVKNYIAHMFEKLGVERRCQAIALYLGSHPTPRSRTFDSHRMPTESKAGAIHPGSP
ncbi:MAG: response regulator transcription factor [Opitutae bacterium]|nr:response regulator transcription factor [Opitutae bacterium]